MKVSAGLSVSRHWLEPAFRQWKSQEWRGWYSFCSVFKGGELVHIAANISRSDSFPSHERLRVSGCVCGCWLSPMDGSCLRQRKRILLPTAYWSRFSSSRYRQKKQEEDMYSPVRNKEFSIFIGACLLHEFVQHCDSELVRINPLIQTTTICIHMISMDVEHWDTKESFKTKQAIRQSCK